MKTHIAQGRLIDPARAVDIRADVWIADGVIVAIGERPDGFVADRRIEAAGLAVLPGLVDLSFDPGMHPDWKSAVAGGIATAVLPSNATASHPPGTLQAPRALRLGTFEAGRSAAPSRLQSADNASPGIQVDFGLQRQAGCIAWSMAEPAGSRSAGVANDRAASFDTPLLWRAMQYARGLGGALWLRPIDPALAGAGVAGGGAYASRLGLTGIPVVAETAALALFFALQRATGARLHIARVTSAEGVALLRDAKREGLPVTCDVAAHHLHVIDVDIGFYDPRYRLDPPLRGARDRDALRTGLADGTIDAVCSHHRAVPAQHSDAPFAQAAAGAADAPLLASLVLKWARETGVPVVQALSKITSGPAAVIAATQPALPRFGRLEAGMPADLCLFDLEDFWLVPDAVAHSGGTHERTPFSGMPMTGRMRATYINGECVWGAGQ